MTAKEVMKVVADRHYSINEDMSRRIDWYSYEENTKLSVEENKTIIRTEMPVKGVYNTLVLYPDGNSEVKMEFD